MIIKGKLTINTDEGEMTIMICDVYPEDAKQLLSKNTQNRNIRQSRVKLYANDIKKGQWKQNGVPIIIGNDGILKDGQHRCRGCIDADKPLLNQIIIYLPKENANCYDIGAARNTSDIAKLEGYTDVIFRSKSIIAAVTFAIGGIDLYTTKRYPSKYDVLEEMNNHKEACFYIYNHLFCTNTRVKINKAGTLAAVYNAYLNEYPIYLLDRFCDVLVNGIPRQETEYGIIRLRDYLNNMDFSGRGCQVDSYFRTQKALYNFRQNKVVSKCVQSSTEYFKHPNFMSER